MEWIEIVRAGYICRILAFGSLIRSLHRSQSCTGISGNSQVLFAVALTARYLALFEAIEGVEFGLPDILKRISMLCCAYYVLYLIFGKYRDTSVICEDRFPSSLLLIGSVVLALIFPYDYSVIGIMHPLSKYLESVAILPHLFLSRNYQTPDMGLVGFVAGNLSYRILVTVAYLCLLESGWPLTCECYPYCCHSNRFPANSSGGHVFVAKLAASLVRTSGRQNGS